MESKDLNEDRIYRDYKVTYHDLNNDLDVFAQFRAGGANGTTVRLSDDSNIKLNDSKLMTHDGNEDFIALNGTYYKTVVKNASPEKNYKLLWKRRDGNQFETKLDLAAGPFEPNIASKSSVSNQRPLSFSVTAAPLQANETLAVQIKGRNASYQEEHYLNSGRTSFTLTIPAHELVRFEGPATLWISREKTRTTKNVDEDIGGSIRVERIAKPVEINFTN